MTEEGSVAPDVSTVGNPITINEDLEWPGTGIAYILYM